jgi:hypothetical protein
MAEPSYSRRAHENVTLSYPPPRIEAEVMDGRWLKTNDKPQWIESIEIESIDGETFIHNRGSAPPSPPDWGRARCDLLFASAADTSDAHAGGLIAHYGFDGMQVEVQANYNLGLLVVATFVTFTLPGPYADRFTREFFFRASDEDRS